jgi:hypothetical protein
VTNAARLISCSVGCRSPYSATSSATRTLSARDVQDAAVEDRDAVGPTARSAR